MKSTEFITENDASMTPDDVKKSAEDAAEYYNVEMHKLFGDDWKYFAKVQRGLGFTLNSIFSEKEFANNIPENAKYSVRTMMHLSDSSGNFIVQKTYEIAALTVSSQLRNAGIKFGKIKGKTPLDAMKKVVFWFKKNKEGIENSDKPNRNVIIKRLQKAYGIPMKERKGKNEITIDNKASIDLDVPKGTTMILQDMPDEQLFTLAKSRYIL